MDDKTQALIESATVQLIKLIGDEYLRALSQTLDLFQVYPDRYRIGTIGDDITCIWFDGEAWNTTFFERGVSRSLKTFDNADDACEDVISRLTYKEEEKQFLMYYREIKPHGFRIDREKLQEIFRDILDQAIALREQEETHYSCEG